MVDTDTVTQIRGGLRAAGLVLLGLGWLGLVLGGLAIAFTAGKYPPFVGWALLVIAAIVLVTTADRWVKALPGLLGLATLNALVSAFSGHATNLPAVPISRFDSIFAALLLAASTAISPSFIGRKLRIVDRIAFLIYAVCILWGAVDHRVTMPVQAGLATLCLFAAWTYDRIRRHGGRRHRPVSA